MVTCHDSGGCFGVACQGYSYLRQEIPCQGRSCCNPYAGSTASRELDDVSEVLQYRMDVEVSIAVTLYCDTATLHQVVKSGYLLRVTH